MAKIKEIDVSLGLSIEIKGVWYRPNARILLELDETDTQVKREKIFKRAWNEVTEQIEKQIKELSE